MKPNFNDPAARAPRKLTADEWEKQAPRRGLEPDPDGLAAKNVHLRVNLWELEQLQKMARRQCMTVQGFIRSNLRKLIFEEVGRDP